MTVTCKRFAAEFMSIEMILSWERLSTSITDKLILSMYRFCVSNQVPLRWECFGTLRAKETCFTFIISLFVIFCGKTSSNSITKWRPQLIRFLHELSSHDLQGDPLQQSFMHTSHCGRIFLHEQSSHELQGANYFWSPSCIHHIGRFSHMNISQMNS